MQNIFFDVDGVMRMLDTEVLGKQASRWELKVKGQYFVDYVSDNLHLLLTAPESEYCSVLKLWYEAFGPSEVTFLTCQPKTWQAFTTYWLKRRFPESKIIFVTKPEEKLSLIHHSNALLVEDYPNFSSYKNIILVDRVYNRHIDSPLLRVKKPADLLQVLVRMTDTGTEGVCNG